MGTLPRVAAAQHPERMAIAFPARGETVSFAQLEHRVQGLARGLRARGLSPGDRVAILGGNSPAWPVAQLAVSRAGGVVVPLNTRLARPEMEYILGHSGARVLIAAASQSLPSSPSIETVLAMDSEESAHPSLSDLWLEDGDEPPEVDPDSLALIIYTSGTTGTPKGVMLSHRNVVNNAEALAAGLGLGPTDRLCTTFPFFHIAGCVMSVLGCLSRGACLVGVDSPGPLPILQALESQRCTAVFGVATMYTDLLAYPELEKFDLSGLRTGTMGGAVCPEPLLRELITRLGIQEMTVSYGLTETSPIITMTGRHDPLDWRTRTVGRSLPGIEVKVVDPATRATLPIDTAGELATRGPHVMMGYYRQPEATERAIDQQGWFYTGDQASLDLHGNVRITGRLKDLIIRGGENISPASVEEVLRRHASVLDACVFGLPDSRLGERVAAALRLHPGRPLPDPEEIRRFCQSELASFKIPSELFFVDNFPLTASGKVKRYQLQAQALSAEGAPAGARKVGTP